MIIAIDFDGTIVENKYPAIGREKPFAIETLLKIQKELNHQLILWTVRENGLLNEAVTYCQERGLNFYAVNKNHPDEQTEGGYHKLKADLFIDDRNIGGLPDWGFIYRMIQEQRVDDTFEAVFRNAFDCSLANYLKRDIFLRIGVLLERRLR
jgi:hypothetical protein